MRFFFDVHGTLVGNPALAESDVRPLFIHLIEQGHDITIWSGDIGGVPQWLLDLAEPMGIPVIEKAPLMLRGCSTDVVVVDDDSMMLRTCRRLGVNVVEAAHIGEL